MRKIIYLVFLAYVFSFAPYSYAQDLIFSHNFNTGTNGADLNTLTPETGTSWTKAEDTAGAGKLEKTSFSDTRAASNTDSQRLVYVAVPASSEPDMSAEFKFTNLPNNHATFTDNAIGLVLRYADTSNYYYCLIYGNNGTDSVIHIGKKVAGSSSSLTNSTTSLSVNDVFRCEVVGTTITLYKNDVSVLSTTDSDLTSAGNGGIFTGNVLVSTDDYHTQARVDDFRVYEIPSEGPASRRIMIIGQGVGNAN